MGLGQAVEIGAVHGDIICVLQTEFSSLTSNLSSDSNECFRRII